MEIVSERILSKGHSTEIEPALMFLSNFAYRFFLYYRNLNFEIRGPRTHLEAAAHCLHPNKSSKL